MKDIFWALFVLQLWSCQGNSGSANDVVLNLVSELAQESAEVLASVDEFTIQQQSSDVVIQSLFCSNKSFDPCIASARVKNFAGCQRGFGTTVIGMITLNFAGQGSSTCSMNTINDSVTRISNFTLQTARGASFRVTTPIPSTGQVLRRTGASQFQFTSSGVRRSYTRPSGELGLDLVTQTTNPLLISGNFRTSRTLVSGALQTTNQITGEVCTFIPNGISWGSSSCNCPSSGMWSVACDTQGSFTISYQAACGEASVVSSTQTLQLQLDRCNM